MLEQKLNIQFYQYPVHISISAIIACIQTSAEQWLKNHPLEARELLVTHGDCHEGTPNGPIKIDGVVHEHEGTYKFRWHLYQSLELSSDAVTTIMLNSVFLDVDPFKGVVLGLASSQEPPRSDEAECNRPV